MFPELMKQLPNVAVVGDTTTGAGANNYTEENIQGEFLNWFVGLQFVLVRFMLPVTMVYR